MFLYIHAEFITQNGQFIKKPPRIFGSMSRFSYLCDN